MWHDFLIRDMTHWFVWGDLFICVSDWCRDVTWTCPVSMSHICDHLSHICIHVLHICIHMPDTTRTYECICVTRCCDVTWTCPVSMSLICIHMSHICIHTCVITRTYECICVTWCCDVTWTCPVSARPNQSCMFPYRWMDWRKVFYLSFSTDI